jgi:hypothetical protein
MTFYGGMWLRPTGYIAVRNRIGGFDSISQIAQS